MNYFKKFSAMLLLTGLFLLPSIVAAHTRIYVRIGPPPVKKVKVIKPCKPHGNYIWVSGHLIFKKGKYVWVSGHWVKNRPGYVYVPAHWKKSPRGWYFVPGHWVKR